ncbi:MAG: hypothetical protein R3D88_02215 [Alphaproteobacteria bacterium]|nr:hypothetical protein [Alphaproteobacteria bacterium]
MSGDDFKDVVQRLRPEDIVLWNESPFEDVKVPEFLFTFFEKLKSQQAERGRAGIELKEAFLYGGALGDLACNNTPKDYDIYIHSPDWVEQIKKYTKAREEAVGFKEVRELSEEEEAWTIGYNCPIKLAETTPIKIKQTSALGEYFEFSGYFDGRVIDIKVGSKPIQLEDFLTYVSAPILAFGAQIDDPNNITYVFHKEGPWHLVNKIMVTSSPDHPDLVEKADRKGWKIAQPGDDLIPLYDGGEGHQDRLGISPRLKAKLGAPVIK